ncbi:hypothetical protein VKI21_13980 [Cyanobacterium aponinum UTEX 3222]|uniref:hypothetical protein n=1 Tax=Cyanobacterium aponinum TaxID=379064 RepID=UPI002B4BC394|nr:hypothetical protein [Cyanobacterium aponinum]WRL37585.1 hypothetical protein VKI22_13275 [Cyanobacterium aponinum UTEX 3221]WRL41152.1 hypothetical protein VKI21_13980 [Cyanobacterium aponinum UTEX 3222]
MKISSKLLISFLFLTGIIFNLAITTSSALSHEGHSHSRNHGKDKEEVKATKNNDKTTEDKKEETKEESHEGHH